MKKLLFFILALITINSSAQTEVFDISTGETGGTLLPIGTFDDTWQVQLPGGGPFVPVRVCSGFLWDGYFLYTGTWAQTTCARWLSPYTVTTPGASFGAGTGGSSVPVGDFTYRTTFMANPNNCPIQDATLALNFLAADNSIVAVKLNGTTYTVPATTFSPLTSPAPINVAGNILSGLNTLDIVVHNIGSYTGLYDCGSITVNYNCPQGCEVSLNPQAYHDDMDCSKIYFDPGISTGSGTTVTGYHWDFGDGSTSNDASPTHYFLYNGTYSVNLTVTAITESGECCVQTGKVTVEVYCDCKPKVDDIVIELDENCNFHFTTSNDHTGTAQFIGWEWDFGDGTVGYGQNVSHQYTSNGGYVVTVYVTAFNGKECCTAEKVSRELEAHCEFDCKLVPSFTYVGDGTTLTFTNTSVALNGTTISGYLWHFGDGTSSTEANPTHTYDPGSYTVCLIIYGYVFDKCCSEKYCIEIDAHEGHAPSHSSIGTENNVNAASGVSQNRPNPFNESTTIDYFINESFSKASIEVFSSEGVLLSTHPITSSGRGQVVIESGQLQPGMYLYRLVVDGKITPMKKMILLD